MTRFHRWLKDWEWGGFLQPLWCRMGTHRPAKAHARKLNGVWNAECVGCKNVMIRTDAGWVLKFHPQTAPQPDRRASKRSKRQ